ncbi:hypothetical protein [Sphingosinicella sp.]|uniref:hypothetical protein n=1 Tax=Sphingosinicella sp. TaxID=1917971 RepID=UPI0040383C42
MANVLVVRSAGPSAQSYRPGRSLGDNEAFTLRAGDTVVVLSSRGTRAFQGPGTFRSTQAGTQVASNSGARIGAVRSAGLDPNMPQPSIWQIDVSAGGTVCLTSATGATLWRPDHSGATRLSIRGPSGASQQATWPAGAATLAWPSAMPIANNASYELTQAGTAVPTRVQVKLIGPVSTEYQAMADTLIRNGCQQQLDLLVDSLPGM